MILIRKLDFESEKEKHIFVFLVGVLIILVGITFYPSVKAHLGSAYSEKNAKVELRSSKTPLEFYKMFQCSCCGRSIDADCCGMSKVRKDYVDELLLDGLDENELVYEMVKKFGFDVLMDKSKEQEIRDYIKDIAPENPPKIEIENQVYDFGTVSQGDGVQSTIFTIKNTGESDLIIDNMDTSCMCTTASLIYNGVEGPIFGMSMHGENPEDYRLSIPEGKSAQLKVSYDPMAHGKQTSPEQKITREVTVISNDPVDFQKKVRIELIQVP